MYRCAALLLVLLVAAVPVRAQDGTEQAVDLLLRRVETLLTAHDRSALRALFAESVERADVERFLNDVVSAASVRTVLRERDRAPLEGVPPGEGYRVVVEFFVEMPGRARILTAGLDLRRPSGGVAESWRIVGAEGLSSVEGLFRLRLDTSQQYAARNLEITSENLVLSLPEGTAFAVESDEGITGMVLLGRGEMRFEPPSPTEQGQLRIFAGTPTLHAAFDSVYIRFNPSDYRRRVTTAALTSMPADPRLARRAQDVFGRESPKSFGVDLQDLTRDAWHLLPPGDDFLAEVDTRNYGTLTFARSTEQAEDVSLVHREKRLTISLYPSAAKLAARGRFYSDDLLRDYDVLDYNVDIAISPERQFIQGQARLAIRMRSSLSTLILRLAEPLVVTSVTSVEYGRMLHLRLQNQNTILINLPQQMTSDSDITLLIGYSGRIDAQAIETETLQDSQDSPRLDAPFAREETKFLLSNRSYWYPQNPVPDYATATMRITVPSGYTPVASGRPMPASDVVTLRDLIAIPDGKVFTFRADQPLRYLAVIVSRLTPVANATLEFPDPGDGGGRVPLAVAIEANPRLRSRAEDLRKPMEDVLQFYGSILGDAPYPSMTIALVENELPGGHSPAYFAVLNDPLPASLAAPVWRNDPASFNGFPEFFLAHELAHQWWGQAVGWKNYHEQWISEGFAQYFAALYAQQLHGDKTFTDMLQQFRRWALSESDQGPVHLGYRLGHIKRDGRVFRALVYNKGAAVLHMLRRLLGDEIFFSGLRRFYQDRRFQKAGTDDLERAFEQESGRSLERFFERWIYGTGIPDVDYRTDVGEDGVTVVLEQRGNEVFDLPVTVTVTYTDGRTEDVVLVMTDTRLDAVIPTSGAVRRVQVNRDYGALAEFRER